MWRSCTAGLAQRSLSLPIELLRPFQLFSLGPRAGAWFQSDTIPASVSRSFGRSGEKPFSARNNSHGSATRSAKLKRQASRGNRIQPRRRSTRRELSTAALGSIPTPPRRSGFFCSPVHACGKSCICDGSLERGLLFLPDSKTGKKIIVLNGPAMNLLATLRRIGAFVIAGALAGTSEEKPRADLQRPWALVSRCAGFFEMAPVLGANGKPELDAKGTPKMRERPTVRLHGLRHIHASIGAGAGLGLPVIGKLLGHSQASTPQRYAHLDAAPLRRASDQIEPTIVAAMGQPAPKRQADEGGEVCSMPRRKPPKLTPSWECHQLLGAVDGEITLSAPLFCQIDEGGMRIITRSFHPRVAE